MEKYALGPLNDQGSKITVLSREKLVAVEISGSKANSVDCRNVDTKVDTC